MKNKKIVVAALGVALCLATVAVGCSSQKAASTQTEGSDAKASYEEFVEAHANAASTNDAYTAMVNAGVTCQDCHNMDKKALYEAYQADPDSITVSNDNCTACHTEAAWPSDELAESLENIADWSTYENAGSPEHVAWVHANSQYTTGRPLHGDYEHACSMCHTMHADTQTMSCTMCHNEDQGSADCASCHYFMEGSEMYGCESITTDDELVEYLQSRLPETGHISSVFTAPEGWTALDSLSAGK